MNTPELGHSSVNLKKLVYRDIVEALIEYGEVWESNSTAEAVLKAQMELSECLNPHYLGLLGPGEKRILVNRVQSYALVSLRRAVRAKYQIVDRNPNHIIIDRNNLNIDLASQLVTKLGMDNQMVVRTVLGATPDKYLVQTLDGYLESKTLSLFQADELAGEFGIQIL